MDMVEFQQNIKTIYVVDSNTWYERVTHTNANLPRLDYLYTCTRIHHLYTIAHLYTQTSFRELLSLYMSHGVRASIRKMVATENVFPQCCVLQ